MDAAKRKRRNRKHPGLMQAAREIGCSYWHLRKCVIGERQSKSLTQKFRTWQRTHQPDPKSE